jgi:1-deoxy-D-xylulose-5-phosphate synthase
VEENAIAGGAGSAVNELLAREGLQVPVINLGLPDDYIDHGNHQQMLSDCGLDAKGIQRSIEAALAPTSSAVAEKQ